MGELTPGEPNGVEVLAFVLWIMLALFCFYLYHQACLSSEDSAEETEHHGLFHAPRHEYAVVVDPTGSIRVGVKNLFSSGMHRIKSIGSSVSSWGRGSPRREGSESEGRGQDGSPTIPFLENRTGVV
ncbi:hypothetical protein BSKO_08002 [Bryopsis sp. KO-2023]|nr:hypothetical protein BSKO_08002 [Bryopsis sp. KO-2023]